MTLNKKRLDPLPLEDITVGSIGEEDKIKLYNILNKDRDCFALTINELGRAKSTEMQINLTNDTPFSYRPYRMSRTEQNIVKDIVEELLSADIIRESDSDYSSPVLLVRRLP